jgi:hypothetical protein
VPFEEQAHAARVFDDYPHEANGGSLNRDALSAQALDQLALLELAVEQDSSVTAVARELGVRSSIERLRREAAIDG